MNTPSAKPPGDRMHSPPPSPASERATAYLHPGQLLVSAQACAVTTILGSCVAVCLWDPVAQIGGINHFLLPTFSGQGIASPRFGNIAIKELLDQLAQLGSQKHNLLAKMFGGACVLEAFRQRQHHLGTKNIEIAQELLKSESIPLVGHDIGGQRGRKLIFHTDDGAACSIAMMLCERFAPGSGWDFEILATDLSTRVLAAAGAAVWPIAKASEIPDEYLKKYMLKGTGEQNGKMKAGAELRSTIRFERLNLNEGHYPVDGNFDLIFCRNVLIYFDTQSRAGAIARLIDHLAPNGYLFVGHAESLHSVTDRVRYVLPTIYTNGSQPQPAVKPKRHGVESAR